MKTKSPLLLFFSLFIVLNLQAQFSSEQRNVTRPDLTTSNFPKDSTANAIVIYEYGNSYVDKNTFKLETEIVRKIKILNRNAFDQATITIPLYYNSSEKEKVVDIRGATYNLRGEEIVKTDLKESDIFEEKYNDRFILTKFTLPNIQEGSVITYSYKLISPFFFNYKQWDFQDDIPTLYSEYNTSIPANWNYNIKLIGGKKLKVNDNRIERVCLEGGRGSHSDCSVSRYVMVDIPAFKEEEFLTAKSNYLARIEYELLSFENFVGQKHNYSKSWKTVDDEFKSDANVGRQLVKTGAVKNLLPDSIVSQQNSLEKAQAIYQYVLDNYVWNGENNLFKEVSIKSLIDKKSGNSTEINILLHNLLDAEGFEILPVLLSTRDNGFLTTIFPVISEFNYLVVQLNLEGKKYLLDATNPYLPFGLTSFKTLNQYGRLLDFKNGSDWVDLNPPGSSTNQYRMELNLQDDGMFNGKMKMISTGYNAISSKRLYFENTNNYLTKLEEKYKNIHFLSHESDIKNKSENKFDTTLEIQITPETIGDKIYLDPFPIKFFSENPFKLEERTYPVDFGYRDSYGFTAVFNIKDDFKVVEIPEKITYALPNNLAVLTVDWDVQDKMIRGYMNISFQASQYPAEVYKELKELFSKAVNLQNNSFIVLEKI